MQDKQQLLNQRETFELILNTVIDGTLYEIREQKQSGTIAAVISVNGEVIFGKTVAFPKTLANKSYSYTQDGQDGLSAQVALYVHEAIKHAAANPSNPQRPHHKKDDDLLSLIQSKSYTWRHPRRKTTVKYEFITACVVPKTSDQPDSFPADTLSIMRRIGDSVICETSQNSILTDPEVERVSDILFQPATAKA